MLRFVAGVLAVLPPAACSDGLRLPGGWQPTAAGDCRAELSASSVGLLQPVTLTVWVLRPGVVRPEPAPLPIPADFAGEVATRVHRYGDGWIEVQVLTLRPTRLGTLKVPPPRFPGGESPAATGELVLEVTSALDAGDDPHAVEAPAGPIDPGMIAWPWLLGGGALLLGVLVWRRRRAAPMPAPPVQAVVEAVGDAAMRELHRLRGASPSTGAEVEAYYVSVSQILRVYLEARFGLRAPMRATEEFLVEVRRGGLLPPDQQQGLGEFLHRCDLVKFARLHPDAEAHRRTLEAAIDFVAATVPRPEAEPQPPAPVGGAA